MSDLNAQEVDNLLDLTLDDLKDLPANEPYPNGTHIADLIEAGTKIVNKHPAVYFKFKYKAAVELAEETEASPKPGDETEVIYMLDNDIGQGKLKNITKPLMYSLGVSSLRQLIEAIKGMEMLIVTTRVFSDAKQRYYGDIKVMSINS